MNSYITSIRMINWQAVVGRTWTDRGYKAEIIEVIHKSAGGSAYPICKVRYTEVRS